MNNMDLKIQKAARKGAFVFQAHFVDGAPWCVYIDGEWAPRGYFTKRQAANIAYNITQRKNIKIKITRG